MSRTDLTVALVGSGGDGVVTAGDLLATVAAQQGLEVIKTEAYGPQIRGGETSCTVRIAGKPISAQGDVIDVLVVFDWADFARFQSELIPAADALVLHEAAEKAPEDLSRNGVRYVPVPFVTLTREATGTAASKNIFTVGLLSSLVGLPAEQLRNAVEEKFASKKSTVVDAVRKAFDAGVEYGRSLERFDEKHLQYVPGAPKLLMSGNEASAIGALHAGCRFFAGYPITPSSEILHFLSEWLPRVGGTALQTEDELAAIGAVIGSSFAGVKSMTATSGPGLSLMSEMIGLAAMAEIPTVVVNVQRAGPSTGIPTKGEQSDLWHALFASHGDAPRVVLAASDVEDCFHTTVEAFNIAEQFQLPVIVLSDQVIGQRKETLPGATLQHDVKERLLPSPAELENYERYRHTDSGVSPMSIPGMPGGMYQTNGLEHDEQGRPSAMFITHAEMNAKRFRKMWPIRKDYRYFRRYGPADAEIGVLCWGSSKGAVKEAIERANASGIRVAAFVPQILFPFPKHEFEEFLEPLEQLLVVELSYSAQFYKYLRTFLDLPRETTHVYKRSGGKPLAVAEVLEQIEKLNTNVAMCREEVLA